MFNKFYFMHYRDRLVHALYVTKSLAILRQHRLIFCGSSDGQACDGQWQQQWLIYDADRQRVLQRFVLHRPKQLQIQWHGNHQSRPGIYFNKWGETGGQQGRFVLADTVRQAGVILIQSGRIRVVNSKTKCDEYIYSAYKTIH